MGGFFSSIGNALGDFFGGAQDFFGGSDFEMNPYSSQSLSALLKLMNSGGLKGNQTYNQGNDYLQNLLSGNPEAFKNFEAPYLQNFNENIVPGIAQRFAGMGTGAGGLRSSALANSLAQAGRSLQTDLAGLRSGLQMQALPQALQYAQQPIQNRLNAASQVPGQFYEIPGQKGLLQSGLEAFAGGVGRRF